MGVGGRYGRQGTLRASVDAMGIRGRYGRQWTLSVLTPHAPRRSRPPRPPPPDMPSSRRQSPRARTNSWPGSPAPA
eukprot:6969046-Pyramimonas_sp.AAC.1